MDIRFYNAAKAYSTIDTRARICYGVSDVRDPVGVIIIHMGKSEWIEKYEEIAAFFERHNIRIIVHEWLGHGRSSRFLDPKKYGYRTHSPDDRLITEAYREFESSPEFQQLVTDSNGKPLPLLNLAHSRGSQLKLRDVIERDGSDEFHLFLSPLFHPKDLARISNRILRAVSWTLCAAGLSRRYAFGQTGYNPATAPFDGLHTSDENRFRTSREVLQRLLENHPKLLTGGATWGWVHESSATSHFIEHGGLEAQRKTLRLCPNALMISAGGDAIVCDARREARLLGIPYYKVSDAPHELLFDGQFLGSVLDLALGFFGKGPNPLQPGMALRRFMRDNLRVIRPQPYPV